MKSEERHQLHENDLASALDRSLKKVEPYSNQMLVGILALAVLVVGALIWQRSSGTASTEGWRQFAKAATADDYLTVADDHPHTEVAHWARLRAGEQFLNQGLRTATSDRVATENNLKQAVTAFEGLLNAGSAVPPQVRERSLYGLAVARETLSNKDTAKAIDAYEALQADFPASRYASVAAQRAKDLGSETTKEFYDWFDRQPRKPEQRPQPKDLATSRLQEGTSDPFVIPDDPQTPDTTTPETTPPTTDGAATPATPGEAAPPAGETPATPPQTDAAPATPATETPPATPGADAPPATPGADTPPASPGADAPPASPNADAPPASPNADAPQPEPPAPETKPEPAAEAPPAEAPAPTTNP